VVVVAVALPVAVVGVVYVPAPFQMVPGALVGVPAIAWLLRRDWRRSPSPPD